MVGRAATVLDPPGAAALAHRREGRSHVAGRAAGQTGMNPDGGIEIGIGRAHDRRRGAPGGKPGDEDTRRIDRMGVAGSGASLRAISAGSPRLAPLVAGRTSSSISGRWPTRSGPDRRPGRSLVLGETVHPGSGGEIVGRLRAAMQHDHQRPRPRAVIGGGDVELVGKRALPSLKRCVVEARAVGHAAAPAAAAPKRGKEPKPAGGVKVAQWTRRTRWSCGGIGARRLCPQPDAACASMARLPPRRRAWPPRGGRGAG